VRSSISANRTRPDDRYLGAHGFLRSLGSDPLVSHVP
jgi:hypothetical protein